ncbi:MAG: alpha-L-rhamnosidase N-terminal domain-containing protein [Prevotella sp.]|nr:alpha-L-rhamnosidase N-terminal domain-containing protein [Prevotella sp.]
MLRLINILILFIASAATAAASTATAGDFDCRWMSHPTPDDTSHVWFSRTIVTSEKDMPRAAYIRVATTGRFVLYVNGRNVSTALFTPDRQKGDTAVAAIAYDVQRFLRTDTNTIALLYCPSMRTHRQVSVSFYGIAADSSHFAVSGTDRPCFALNGNAGWLCRHADTWQTHDGGEAMNRNLYPYRWTDANQPLALWQAVEETSPSQPLTTTTPHHLNTPTPQPLTTTPPQPLNTTTPQHISTSQHLNTTPPQPLNTTTPLSSEDICGYNPLRINPLVDNAARISRIYTPLLTEQSGDTLTVHLVPNRRHLIRVTLRGCRRGERIRIGNLQYVCTGEMDEQAFTRFSPTDQNTVTICGDRHFCCEQVQEVESICL